MVLIGIAGSVASMVERLVRSYRYHVYRGNVERIGGELAHLGKNVILHEDFNILHPENIHLYDNVWIGKNAFLCAKDKRIVIGRNCVISENARLLTFNHFFDSDKRVPFDETIIAEEIIVGDHVWMGFNCLLVPGVTIGEGAVVGMGSVVTRDVPPLAVVGGNPAKVLKYRNELKYQKAKERLEAMTSDEIFKEWLEPITNKDIQLRHKIS